MNAAGLAALLLSGALPLPSLDWLLARDGGQLALALLTIACALLVVAREQMRRSGPRMWNRCLHCRVEPDIGRTDR